MFDVYINYKGNKILVHSRQSSPQLPHLVSGSLVQGINTADSFSFDILPFNNGFDFLVQYATEISVINVKKNEEIFDGRVLDIKDSMNDDGTILKNVVCESSLGFLQDSLQPYLNPRNWTRKELLLFILNNHNSQVEEQKQIFLGDITVTGIDENIYIGLQRQNSFEAIKEKLIDKIGGEIRIRKENNKRYLDYADKFGSYVETPIKIKVNMKNLSKEDELNSIITRLYPYGAKIEDEENLENTDNDNRVDITSVNNGIPYIEDKTAIEVYGIIEGTHNWDDVTLPKNLLSKATEYLNENNRIKRKYSINSLDLSLINKKYDEIDVYNYYPVKNNYLNVDENLRVIKKTTNILNPTEFSVELGDTTKSILDMQIEERNKYRDLTNSVIEIQSNYVTNEKLNDTKREINNTISQIEDDINLSVSEKYVSKTDFEDFQEENNSNIDIRTDSILEEVSKTQTILDQLADDTNNNMQRIEESFLSLQTATQQRFEVVQAIIDGGVETLKNKLVIIDIDGIKVATNESALSVLITNEKFVINRYDMPLAEFSNEGAILDNLVVRNYLTEGYHRVEKTNESGEKRTRFFYMGDDME